MREIKFEYGFESVNGIVKKVYHLHEIPNIKELCDVWDVLPIAYVRQFTGAKINNIDLYEWDIVRVYSGKNWHSNFDYNVVIKFGDFCKGNDAYSQTKGFGAYTIKDDLRCGLSFLNQDYGYDEPKDAKVKFEIIGNLLTNPELL